MVAAGCARDDDYRRRSRNHAVKDGSPSARKTRSLR